MYWLWIGIFVGNLLLSFIPASVARNKGHSFGGYWALSTFLVGWLIGLIIAACLSNRLLNNPNNIMNTNVNVVTPTPIFNAPQQTVYTPPMQQPNYSAPAQPPVPQNTEGSKFCSNCGAKVKHGAQFCNNCGGRI